MLRAALASLATAACLLSAAGCEGEGAGHPAPIRSTDNFPNSPTTSRPTIPVYLVTYTAEERTAYAGAVVDYAAFSHRQAKFDARGRATRAARAFYRERTAAWHTYWAKLRALESDGLQIIGMGKTLRVRPASIRLDETGGGEVDLRVCGVSEGVQVLRNGKPVPQPDPHPTIVRVRMVQLPDETFWRLLSERVGSPC